MGCNCKSTNKPEWGGTELPVSVRCDVERLIPEEDRQWIEIDFCIVGAIKRLWAVGIETGHCCCGHGVLPCPEVGVLNANSVPHAARILSQFDEREWRVWAYSTPGNPEPFMPYPMPEGEQG